MTKEEAAKLTTLVREAYDAAIAADGRVKPDWLVHDIVSRWSFPNSPDAIYQSICCYSHVRKLVNDVQRQQGGPSSGDDSSQLGRTDPDREVQG